MASGTESKRRSKERKEGKRSEENQERKTNGKPTKDQIIRNINKIVKEVTLNTIVLKFL